MKKFLASSIVNIFAAFNLNKWKAGKIDKAKCMLLTEESGQKVYVYTEDGTLLDKNIVIADEQGMPTEAVPENNEYVVSTPEGEMYKIVVADGLIVEANEMQEEMAGEAETQETNAAETEAEAKKEDTEMKKEDTQMLLLTFQKIQNSHAQTIAQRDEKILGLETRIAAAEAVLDSLKLASSQSPKTQTQNEGSAKDTTNFLRKLNPTVEKLVKGK